MKKVRSVSVSCVGDMQYKDLLRALSLQLGVPQGLLVRIALDTVFESDLRSASLFFGHADEFIPHKMNEINNANHRREAQP